MVVIAKNGLNAAAKPWVLQSMSSTKTEWKYRLRGKERLKAETLIYDLKRLHMNAQRMGSSKMSRHRKAKRQKGTSRD